MIVVGLIILLVILIIANFAIGMFNQVAPPCSDSYEYFSLADKMPDGVSHGLGSIPTHNWVNYIGAKRADLKLTSYIGDVKNTDSMTRYLKIDDPSDCKDAHCKDVSQNASQAINTILQVKKPDPDGAHPSLDKSSKVKNGVLSEYAIAMEGRKAKNMMQAKLRGDQIAYKTTRDGYNPSDTAL